MHDRTVLYAVKRSEAYALRTALATCDSTKHDALIVAANEEEHRMNVERQYIELDKRTVPKSALPWWVLAGAVIGYLLGSGK